MATKSKAAEHHETAATHLETAAQTTRKPLKLMRPAIMKRPGTMRRSLTAIWLMRANIRPRLARHMPRSTVPGPGRPPNRTEPDAA